MAGEPQEVTFERTQDYGLVKEIATHPMIYPAISPDGSPEPEDWQPLQSDLVWYVLVKDEGELLGMFALAPQNPVCWEIHTCLLPKAWGSKAREAGKEIAEWIFQNTPCLRIVTNVPEYNRLAFKLAIECGLIRYGYNPASYMKDGKLHDQIMLGVSKCL